MSAEADGWAIGYCYSHEDDGKCVVHLIDTRTREPKKVIVRMPLNKFEELSDEEQVRRAELEAI